MRPSSRRWLCSVTLAALLVGSAGLSSLSAREGGPPQLQAPRSVDRQVSRVVASIIKREHLTQHPLDNEISQRAMKLFIKNLDNMKLYFTQADIDEFNKHVDLLDEDFASGDISFAYTVFQRYLKRLDERLATIDELLKGPFDYEKDEVLVTDPEKISFATTAEELNDRWRKRIKYDMLALRADKKVKETDEQQRARLYRRYHSFASRMHQTDADNLLEIFLTSITNGYDPHTTYMSPSTLENFRIIMGLHLEGIGAALQVNDGYTEISKLIPGGAAEKSGLLKVDDRVVSVSKDDKMIDVTDMKLDDIVKLIRGKPGTIVRMGIISADAPGQVKIIDITRQKIELTDSEARGVVFEDGLKQDGTPFKVGVIDLPSFYMDMEAARDGGNTFKSTTRDVRKILEKFNKDGVDALVLDLRRNGGGSLTEAISLTGLFIDEGPVVQVKDPDGRVQHYDDLDRGMAWSGPMVVLTSKFSASASEILAGAIQDYRRGLVIGDTSTHGKGTVQSLLDLGPQMFRIANPPNLGALKITMQQFYRPNGDSTQKKGVVSDVALPSLTDHMDISEGDLDYPVEFDQVKAAPFNVYASVNQNVIKKLDELSAVRRKDSSDFQKLLGNIEKYKEQKARKEVPLKEELFLARRKELDSDKEEEKQFEEQANGSEEIVKRDFYFNEVLAITVDYLKILGKDKVAQASK